MSKRNFEQNLGTLFKGTAPSTEAKPQEEPKGTQEESLSGRADIISTIEDEELRAALRAKRLEGRGRPRAGQNKESRSLRYSRACFWVNIQKYDTLKEIALRETKTTKEMVEEAFDLLITKYNE